MSEWQIKSYKVEDSIPFVETPNDRIIYWDEEEFNNMSLPEFYHIYVLGPFGQAVRVR